MCRMIKRHGGLTQVQQHIFAGIVNGSVYEQVQDGSVLHMGNESTAPILGRGKVLLEFSSEKS